MYQFMITPKDFAFCVSDLDFQGCTRYRSVAIIIITSIIISNLYIKRSTVLYPVILRSYLLTIV